MIEMRVFLVLLSDLKSFAHISNVLCGLIAIGAFASGFASAQTCPVGATGSCTVVHSTPGCVDSVCCALVCANDPYCCSTSWTQNCVSIASILCTTPPPTPCGSASAGSCTVVHPTPSCSNAACCEAVCSVQPYCCSVSWDSTCVSSANLICGTNCTPACPPRSMAENEPCDTAGNGNSPCVNGAVNTTLLTVANSQWICGSIRYVAGGTSGLPDFDAYKLVLTDTNGDGFARVAIDIQAEYGTMYGSTPDTVPMFVALLSQPCAPLSSAAFAVQSSGCLAQNHIQCVPVGTWYVVVARGTFPTAQSFPYACSELQSYNLKVTWDDVCSGPCGSSGDCFANHETPGCATVACCSAVCNLDPYCCSSQWDQTCVDRALSICTPPPPPLNDQCSQATPFKLGEIPFTTVGATSSTIPIATGCFDSSNISGWSIPTTISSTGLSYNVGIANLGVLTSGTSLSSLHTASTTSYTSPAGNGSLYSFSSNNWVVGSYYEVKVSTLNYEGISISWDQTRTANGPVTFDLRMSTNGGTVWTTILASYTVIQAGAAGTSTSLWSTTNFQSAFTRNISIAEASNQAEVRFQMRAVSAGTSTSGTSSIDNVAVSGLSKSWTGPDVWFRLHDIRGEIGVSTCGPGSLNTALMVYSLPCTGAPTPIACNSNNSLCFKNPLASYLTFPALCGSEYLIRVAGSNGSIGAGTLTVTSTQTACSTCLGDYNNDGQRNGTDLAFLLSGWNTSGSDVTGDGVTDGADLTLLLSGWGACPP